MTVFRQIQISIWQDKFFLELDPLEKYFFLYLLTNSKTKQCGIYQIPEQVMLFETGLKVEEIKKYLSKFEACKKIKYNKENSEIMIINWLKYNRNQNNKNVIICIEKELKDVKTREFLDHFYALCIEHRYSIHSKSKKEEEKKEEKEIEKEKNIDIEKRKSFLQKIARNCCYNHGIDGCKVDENTKNLKDKCIVCLSVNKNFL